MKLLLLLLNVKHVCHVQKTASRTMYENDVVHIRGVDVEHDYVLAEATTLWYLTFPQI